MAGPYASTYRAYPGVPTALVGATIFDGADALGDLVMWDDDPLNMRSASLRVFIEGVDPPLSNHQTRLAQRYRDLDRTAPPPPYVR